MLFVKWKMKEMELMGKWHIPMQLIKTAFLNVMILSSDVIVFPLISGTISFLEGSILHADELSITVVPQDANFGAHSREIAPPAENIARCGCSSKASSIPTTVISFPS